MFHFSLCGRGLFLSIMNCVLLNVPKAYSPFELFFFFLSILITLPLAGREVPEANAHPGTLRAGLHRSAVSVEGPPQLLLPQPAEDEPR